MEYFKKYTFVKQIAFSLLFLCFLSINSVYGQQDPPPPNVVDFSNTYSPQGTDLDTSENGNDGVGGIVDTSRSYTSGDATDIGTPAESPFELGGDISGIVQNSVNQVTGKVTFSLPLAGIEAGSAGYQTNLLYDGQASFKTAKEANKYSPTTTVGVGWSLANPKIVVDNKQTGSRDDDVFYLQDGSTNSKLICINRGTNNNGSVWEFQSEKYMPWKIKFFFHDIHDDYWQITKEDGVVYTYGDPDITPGVPSGSYSREYIYRFENWIGESMYNGFRQTIVWNLYKIEDQWKNNLIFKYEQINQVGQTEASYLKEIASSKGSRIELNYGYKTIFFEVYEPHQEMTEPDAYQERYEKKYLQNVKIYNTHNQLDTTYNLDYFLDGDAPNKKRYLNSLTKVSHENGQDFSLPPQEFEYHLTGDFKGGLKKVTYPTGGSATYNYGNKYLYYNGSNKFMTPPNYPTGYLFYSSVVRDNYSLFIMRTVNPVSGGKYRFKIFRYWWNGEKWEDHEFTFPHLIADDYPNAGDWLKDFYSVLGNDFYGFVYDKGDNADIYLFHLEKEGNTWNYFTHSNLSIEGGDPSFISGNEFVALGSHNAGRLFTYFWDGTSWHYNMINQGDGIFHYGAKNNYIITLDLDGNSCCDNLTGYSHEDYFYFHYLDAEKKWQSKSWSSYMDIAISDIDEASYFYTSNSMTSFVADNNPEYFIRWDDNYDIIGVDNVLGAYFDGHPIQPIDNSLFTLHNWFYGIPYKSARYNGVNWSVHSLPSSSSYYPKLSFGKDYYTFQNHDIYNNGVGFHIYDPNTNIWGYELLNNYSWDQSNYKLVSINPEFVISGNSIYKKNTYSIPIQGHFSFLGGINFDNVFTYSDGLSHAYVKQNNNGAFVKGTYFYMDKESETISNIDLGLKYNLRGSPKIGGYTPFMSPRSIWLRHDNTSNNFNPYLYRIINDKVNNNIYDIVVDNIELDNNEGEIRKTEFTYSYPKTLNNNNATFYGEVTVENKGFGSNSIGKITKLFNTGSDDIQMLGLLLEVQVRDASNTLKSKTTNTWQKFLKTAHNGSYTTDISHYIQNISIKEEMFYGNENIFVQTDNTYNSLGLLTNTTRNDSKGNTESQEITYAYQQYPFVQDKNILTAPYEVKSRINSYLKSIKKTIWQQKSIPNVVDAIYSYESWSKTNNAPYRLINQVSRILIDGNIRETNNGKGIFNTILYGYLDLYPVATIKNATYDEVINELDVSYGILQTLNTQQLKAELIKLYDRLPNAVISINLYDDDGKAVTDIDSRKDEIHYYYDSFGRLDYTTDNDENILEVKEYKYGD